MKNDDALGPESSDEKLDRALRRVFDDAPEMEARADDEARIEAAIGRTLRAVSTPEPSAWGSGRAVVYLAAAALAVGALAYAAGHRGSAGPSNGTTPAEAPSVASETSAMGGGSNASAVEPSPAAPGRGAPEPAVSPESLPTAPPARPASVASTQIATSARAPANHEAPVGADEALGPAELFARANDARRASDTRRAIALYEELQTKFPASREASTSRVALGRLLLDRAAEPARARSLFNAYLDHDPSGALGEEARVGRALASMRLSDRQAERAAWVELLERHPDSVHAERARQRLVVLGN